MSAWQRSAMHVEDLGIDRLNVQGKEEMFKTKEGEEEGVEEEEEENIEGIEEEEEGIEEEEDITIVEAEVTLKEEEMEIAMGKMLRKKRRRRKIKR